MMISRGVVLVRDEDDFYTVQAIKGLDRNLYGKKLSQDCPLDIPFILTEDEGAIDCMLKRTLAEWGIRLVLPVISTNRTVGIVGLGEKVGNRDFTDAEIEYLSSLSNIAAKSIENALVYQKLERVNRQLDKKVQELNTLFDISKELNSTLDREKIVNLLMFAIMGEMLVNRILVYLKEDRGLELIASKGINADSKEWQRLNGKGFLKSLALVDRAILIDDTDVNRNLLALKRSGLKAIIPMRIQGQNRGMIVLGAKITGETFKSDDLEFLTTLGSRAMISLENARLFEEALEKQRIEKELLIARDIQQKLLPDEIPHIAGFDIAGINLPSRQVGGDYFDYIRIDDHRFGLAIADVSGKGVPASLLMSNLHAALHSLILSKVDISDIAGRVNNLIQAHTAFDKFITFFYAEVDTEAKTLTYVNAGHNPPYLYHSDGSSRILDKGGVILGMMPDMPYETETVPLQKGDLVFMFTDGVSEAQDLREYQFEEWRIEKLLSEHLNDSAKALLDLFIEELQKFTKGAPQSDDVTMLIMKVTE